MVGRATLHHTHQESTMTLRIKRLATLLAASGIAIASASAPSFAQSSGNEQHYGRHVGHHGGQHGDHMRGGFLRGLNLSEAQKDQIFKLKHDQAPAQRELMKSVRRSHEDLRKL